MDEQRYSELRVFESHPGESKSWELIEPVSYTTIAGETITAPTAMRTDFASVPWPLRWVVPQTGRHNRAAVIHDYQWGLAETEGTPSRKVADDIFREGLEHLGVTRLRRWMMWTAVRHGAIEKELRARIQGKDIALFRSGPWPLSDIALVLGITLLLAPIVVLVTPVVIVGRLLIWAIDAAISIRRRDFASHYDAL